MGDMADDELMSSIWHELDDEGDDWKDGFSYHPYRHRWSSKPRGPGECPECGAETVPRKGPYGNFYGCSTFPKCRGTRKH